MKKKHERRRSEWKETIRNKKPVFIVYVILRLFVICALVLSLIRGNYESVFICLLTLVLFLLPAFLQRKWSLELPSALEIIILVFIFAAEILGELQSYYLKYPYWDTMLHTTNGFLCAAVGFSILDLFNRNPRLKFQVSASFLALTSFCFSMTVGVVWEFFEFFGDMFLRLDMQKDTILHSISTVELDPTQSNTAILVDDIQTMILRTGNGQEIVINGYLDIGLYDTMEDLLVNFIGAVLFCIIGYFYIKKKGEGKFASQFIPRIREDIPS